MGTHKLEKQETTKMSTEERQAPATGSWGEAEDSSAQEATNFEEIGDGQVISSNYDEVVESFDDMGLKDELCRGIYNYGFENPSPIQQRAIVPVLKGLDVIAQAQSGTGKTATFAISVLQSVDPELRATQALILAPTRELANQIYGVVSALGLYLKVDVHSCIGGTIVRDDIRRLEQGIPIVVGCPGRVHDLI